MNRQVMEEASVWFVEFRVGDVDAAASARFDEWLRRSPEHIRAYMGIAKTYVGLAALDPNHELDVQKLIACARAGENVVLLGQTPKSTAASASTAAGKMGSSGRHDPRSPDSEPGLWQRAWACFVSRRAFLPGPASATLTHIRPTLASGAQLLFRMDPPST